MHDEWGSIHFTSSQVREQSGRSEQFTTSFSSPGHSELLTTASSFKHWRFRDFASDFPHVREQSLHSLQSVHNITISASGVVVLAVTVIWDVVGVIVSVVVVVSVVVSSFVSEIVVVVGVVVSVVVSVVVAITVVAVRVVTVDVVEIGHVLLPHSWLCAFSSGRHDPYKSSPFPFVQTRLRFCAPSEPSEHVCEHWLQGLHSLQLGHSDKQSLSADACPAHSADLVPNSTPV